MYIVKLPNAAASLISVTATATSIYSLIDTAASSAAGLDGRNNAIDINVEDGDIRILFDGNTPTASNGILLSSGTIYQFRGVPLTQMQLIRVGGSNVSCSVQVGRSDASETSNAAAYAVTIGSIDGTYTEDSQHESGDEGLQVLTVRNDVLAALAGTDGDYAPIQVGAKGGLFLENMQKEDEAYVADDYVSIFGGEADDPTGLAAVTEGDVSQAKFDLAGRLIVTLGTKLSETEDAISTTMITGTQVGDGSPIASLDVASGAGTLYGLWVTNNTGATVYYQVFDVNSLPNEGTLPDAPPIAVSDGVSTIIDFRDVGGFDFTTGCWIIASSTLPDKTITGALNYITAWKK
jgi:hypothetical protein